MSDLIDRDNLKTNISKAISYCAPEIDKTHLLAVIMNVINEADAVDATSVIRCKDCDVRALCGILSNYNDDFYCANGAPMINYG